jgi:ABC-type bacteriocin/lantibiotic exporter with double-glycine peptidase domain
MDLLREEKSDITAIYFFAVLSSLIQLSLPLGIQAIIGFVMAGTLSASLVVLISVLVVGVLLSGIMQINQMKIIEKIQQRIFVRFSYAFTDRIPRLDLKKVDSLYLPELVNRFFDITSLQKNLSKLLLDLPIATIQILFGLILLSFYHPFFIVFGLLLLVLLWLIIRGTGDKGMQSSIEESNHKYGIAGWFEEMARMIKSFKFHSSSGLHFNKADQRAIGYLKARTQHFGVLLTQYGALLMFKVLITGAMLIVGVTLLLDQQINIGQFVAAEIIIITVINSVEKIIINLDSVYDVLTAIEKVSKITDKPVEASGTFLMEGSKGVSLEVRDLQFGYEPGRHILRHVSLSVAAGEKICVTGADGSGKSTLLRVLTGLYREFNGSYQINGVPMGNYDLESLRNNIGILFPQESVFNGTLWENISMGRADIDRSYVSVLCERVGLQPFLFSLIEGFDTELDPTGKRLPRNVIQKILLVRALAHKPELLVLEEPWLGIEEQYKYGIERLLLDLPGTTVIVATNEESFAAQCTQIIRL